MQEHFEQTSTAEMQSITHWDELHKEVYSDHSSLLPTAINQDRLNFDAIQLHFKCAYDTIRNSADFAGEEPVSIQSTINNSNEQAPESPERDSSRLNREEDRQPYMDAARHQNTSAPINEQSAELPDGFSSRMNREDDRQPYLDRERHQYANITAL